MEAHLQLEAGSSRGAPWIVRQGQTVTFGQSAQADVRLEDASLAPRHMAVVGLDDGVQVVDLGGPGGVLLNGEPLPVRRATDIQSGDELRLGAHALRLRVLGVRRRRKRGKDLLPAGEFANPRPLGVGAMGQVFAATWRRTGGPVAIKLLRDQVAPGSSTHQRFLREAQLLGRLACPFIVRVLDVRLEEPGSFVVMEWVDGPSLEPVLKHGALPVGVALKIAEDIARALSAAASQRIVHRDVKPANVLLCRRTQVAKLCDFGLAKDLQATLHSLTRSGVGLGTLAYMAPEQLTGAKHADGQADVYALGATLYHMLVGRPPLQVETPEALQAISGAPLPSLRSVRPGLPEVLDRAVMSLLHAEPARRPEPARVPGALEQLRRQHAPGDGVGAFFTGL